MGKGNQNGARECAICHSENTKFQWHFQFSPVEGGSICDACFGPLRSAHRRKSKPSPQETSAKNPTKRLKTKEENSYSMDPDRCALFRNAERMRREFQLSELNVLTINEVFEILAEYNRSLFVALNCEGKWLFFDFIYKEVVDVNPNAASVALYDVLKDLGLNSFHVRRLEVDPQKLEGFSSNFLELPLLTEAISIRKQLEDRLLDGKLNAIYSNSDPKICTALVEGGLRSPKKKVSINSEIWLREQVEPILEDYYPQIRMQISSKLNGTLRLNVVFLSEEKLTKAVSILVGNEPELAARRCILRGIFNAFRNGMTIAQRAPNVLKSISDEQDLLEMFRCPPVQCLYESFVRLQVISDLLEIKAAL